MSRSRLLTLVMSALLLSAGVSCSSENTPTAVSATTPVSTPSASLLGGTLGVLGNALSPLVSCAPQPYATGSAIIGPQGGTVVIGRHRLVVPSGALSSPVEISGDAPVGDVVSVRFHPEGLTFNAGHPARLTLDYSHCSLLNNLIPKHIAYTNEQLNILDLLLSSDNLLTHKVSANVQHFSRYAIAW